jgi:hypothetical protein
VICLALLLILVLVQILMVVPHLNGSRLGECVFYLLLDMGFTFFTSSLVIYHCFLVGNNLTTYEYLRTEDYMLIDYSEMMY